MEDLCQWVEIYKALRKTPIAFLYGMASWFEDLAELTNSGWQQ
jgi:hypothetical protein